jgi:hypothetical protein
MPPLAGRRIPQVFGPEQMDIGGSTGIIGTFSVTTLEAVLVQPLEPVAVT